MSKKYTAPELELLLLELDVITTSWGDNDSPLGGDTESDPNKGWGGYY